MPQTGIEQNRQLNILKIRHFRDIKYHTCDKRVKLLISLELNYSRLLYSIPFLVKIVQNVLSQTHYIRLLPSLFLVNMLILHNNQFTNGNLH